MKISDHELTKLETCKYSKNVVFTNGYWPLLINFAYHEYHSFITLDKIYTAKIGTHVMTNSVTHSRSSLTHTLPKGVKDQLLLCLGDFFLHGSIFPRFLSLPRYFSSIFRNWTLEAPPIRVCTFHWFSASVCTHHLHWFYSKFLYDIFWALFECLEFYSYRITSFINLNCQPSTEDGGAERILYVL